MNPNLWPTRDVLLSFRDSLEYLKRQYPLPQKMDELVCYLETIIKGKELSEIPYHIMFAVVRIADLKDPYTTAFDLNRSASATNRLLLFIQTYSKQIKAFTNELRTRNFMHSGREHNMHFNEEIFQES